jgi:hypothetical protein
MGKCYADINPDLYFNTSTPVLPWQKSGNEKTKTVEILPYHFVSGT